MQKPEKIYIRTSNAADIPAIESFYKKYPHEHVRARDPAVFGARISEGTAFLIEKKGGEILGCSITYPLKSDENPAQWHEIGTTRIALGGYPQLFNFFLPLQVVSAFILYPPGDRLVARMKDEAVKKRAKSMGWRPFPDVSGEVLARKRDMHPGQNIDFMPEDWFQFTRETLPAAAGLMAKVMDDPVLLSGKGKPPVVLDFSRLEFFHYLEPEIRRLAAQAPPSGGRHTPLPSAPEFPPPSRK